MRSKKLFPGLALGWLFLLHAAWVLAGPGDLDVRLGREGWVDLPVGTITGAASLPDGSIVVAGYEWPASSAPRINPMPEQRVVRVAPSGQLLWTRSFDSGFTGVLHRLGSGRLLVGLSDYAGNVGRLVALREDGSTDTAFGEQGQLILNKRQIVTGLGHLTPHVAAKAIRELPDGSLLVAATVADDTVATAWDPVTVGVQFRITATGLLLTSLVEPVESLKQRSPTDVEVLPDGRGMLLAGQGCCVTLRSVLMTRDEAGVLSEAPVSDDAAWSPLALASDPAQSRFYALGLLGTAPTLTAIRGDGTADPGFGADGTGRVSLSLPTAKGRLWIDEAGSILSAVAVGEPDWWEPDLLKRIGSRAEVFIEARDFLGRADPRIAAGRVLPLTTSPGMSAARIVAITRADPGFVWIVASLTGEAGLVGRVARLQLGPGSGAGTLGFERTAIRISEQGPSKLVRVLRSGGNSGAVSVRYEIRPMTDGLVTSSGTLSWADGDASPREIELVPQDDVLVQGERIHTVRLVDPQGGVALSGETLAVTIEDDEVLAQLKVGAAAAQITAGDVAQFQVTLQKPVKGPVSVTVLVGDDVDDAGAPRYQERNSSGIGYQTLVWKPGRSGMQVFRMHTNSNRDVDYAVDLHLRLVTDAGWLVRTPSGSALGTAVRVVGGEPPAGSGNRDGAAPAPASISGDQGGGGATGMASLVLLASWLARRAARRVRHAQSVRRGSTSPQRDTR